MKLKYIYMYMKTILQKSEWAKNDEIPKNEKQKEKNNGRISAI